MTGSLSNGSGPRREEHLPSVGRVEALKKSVALGPAPVKAKLALAWVLARGDGIAPIPGTKRRRYLEENVGAIHVQLSRENLGRIDRVISPDMGLLARAMSLPNGRTRPLRLLAARTPHDGRNCSAAGARSVAR
ncbi:MAG: aldo/keto reductase [Gemmatimonadales bacterium]